MGYYIWTELKKALRTKYTLYYSLAIVVLCLLANLSMSAFRNIIYGMNDGTFAYNLIMFAKGFFWIPYYTCFFLADIVFGETYPDPRLRDRSTIGLGRTKLFFGKFFAELLLLLLAAAFALVLFLTVTPVFQVHDGTINAAVILDFAKAALIAMPLFAVGVSIGNMFLFSLTPKRNAFIADVLFVIILPRIIMYLATDHIRFAPCVFLSKYLITPQFQTLQFYATRDVPKILISSAVYIAITCAIGCWSFRRKKF